MKPTKGVCCAAHYEEEDGDAMADGIDALTVGECSLTVAFSDHRTSNSGTECRQPRGGKQDANIVER